MSTNSKGIQLEFNANILDCFIKFSVILYTDDTILISESPKDLQSMLDAMYSYCDK